MHSYRAWCEHYEYDPVSDEAKADYRQYCDALMLFQGIEDSRKSEVSPSVQNSR